MVSNTFHDIGRALAFGGGVLVGVVTLTATLWRSLAYSREPLATFSNFTELGPLVTPLWFLLPVGLLACALVLFGAAKMEPGGREQPGVLATAGGALAFSVLGTAFWAPTLAIAGGAIHLALASEDR